MEKRRGSRKEVMAPTRDVITMTSFLLLIAIGVGVRFRPFRTNANLGVDHWYWLLCAEDIKKRRRLPPRLPYFMLEIEEQWYPPLYAALLALLPMKVLERHAGKISQLLDLMLGLLIFFSVLWASGHRQYGVVGGRIDPQCCSPLLP